MLAVEKAKELRLTRLWMETDSMAVVNAFHKAIGIPWKMRRQYGWHNCMHFCTLIGCTCTHILREDNMAADALAKNEQGLAMFSSQWWPSPPPFISSFLLRDSLGLPFSRITMD
jgi:ribonuclease HI